MNLRRQLQEGRGRALGSVVLPVVVGAALFQWWPADVGVQRDLLSGFQKVSFVAAAFAVTAYNLRTRVVDLVLKVDGKPSRVEEFCRKARECGRRLTNLVILFTMTALALGGLTICTPGTIATRIATAVAVAMFIASIVSFLYILFAFERLERFALDEAEQTARAKEASRLLTPAP